MAAELRQVNAEWNAIVVWLGETLGYPEYIRVFRLNGFDRWDIICLLTPQLICGPTSLIVGGPIKLGHALRILSNLHQARQVRVLCWADYHLFILYMCCVGV